MGVDNSTTRTITTLAQDVLQMGIGVFWLLHEEVMTTLGFEFETPRSFEKGRYMNTIVSTAEPDRILLTRSIASSERRTGNRRARVTEVHAGRMPVRESDNVPDETATHSLRNGPGIPTSERIVEGIGGVQLLAPLIQQDVRHPTGDVRDVLYTSKTRTVQPMLLGDYTKYLDDSSKALAMWKETWDNVNLPSHLNGLLSLQFEYLRLDINTFTF
ncbi:hypothetical protein BBP40_003635 [Aspergillus hancockii]|nr:hypothetical protein BBP40_003635 [Aspergillus hancockii]